MWEIDIGLQFYYWLLSAVLGGMFCIFYDLFRAVRLAVSHSVFTIFIEDILYFCFISFFSFCFLLATTNGQVRGFVIFGIVIGFFITRCTVSFVLMKIYSFVLKWIFKILNFANRFKNRVFGYFETVFSFILKKTRIFFKKALNGTKKLLKKE